MACACSRTCAAPCSNHPASSGHAPQPPPGTTTVPGMSALPLNITMNRNRARPFYTEFRTPPRTNEKNGTVMAQKIQTLFVDDLDGSEAEGTVRFGLDGTEYEIDLNARHAKELRNALARYAAAARRT